MEVIIVEQPGDVAVHAADAIEDLATSHPAPVLGLATGSTPRATYEETGRRIAAGRMTLARARAFMLDEYVGLPPHHPQSYRSVIDAIFTTKVDIDPANVAGPDGNASDVLAACAAYERAIAEAGGIDLQILGIGGDGHIAFNEPGSSLASATRIKTLIRATRQDNARFFEGVLDAVPSHCLTQGVATILRARHIVLLALGEPKAEAVRHAVEGPVSAMCPASALQLHPHVTVILDEGAASRLEMAAYYREVWENKPPWQRL